MKYKDVTNPRQQQLDAIERIEGLPRPQIWAETKKFLLAVRPDLREADRGFIEACRELREVDLTNPTNVSKGGSMRNTMKIPQYIFDALVGMDQNLQRDLGSKNGEAAAAVGKQLYNAFPEYRIARKY